MRVKEVKKYYRFGKRKNPYMYKPILKRDKDGKTFKDILEELWKKQIF